jgi:hypothetical protein
MLETIGRTA